MISVADSLVSHREAASSSSSYLLEQEGSFIPDVLRCGCADPNNCRCPDDGGGCMSGFCFCARNGQLEYEQRRCHPAYDNSNSGSITSSTCPIACFCGCREHEICGDDGRCYCPDGSLVLPIVDADTVLVGKNQTCPPKPLEEMEEIAASTILPPPPLDNPARVINSSNATSVADASSLPFLLFLSSFLSFLCLLVALLILLLGIGFYRRRRRKQQGAGENETAASFNPMGEGGLKTMTENDLYESAQLLSADTLNLIGCKAVLDQERVVLERQIGAGNFGKVYKGRYTTPGGQVREVAVKVPRLDQKGLTSQLGDFYQEAKIAISFDHENILECLGVCNSTGVSYPVDANNHQDHHSGGHAHNVRSSAATDADRSASGLDDQHSAAISMIRATAAPWLVFEFMAYGDLSEVLRSNSGVLSLQKEELPILKMADLWWLSIQIARGMKYLADLRFTHRDLAARNCLVGKNLVLKISDFGLTRDVYTNEYYQMGDHRMLPIRWMAPESIQFGKFSTETDIWSYGVVLWEIFTFGKRPYFEYSNQEVAMLVPTGMAQLHAPAGCPDLLKLILESCCQRSPENRISFAEIIQRLEESVSQLFAHSNPGYSFAAAASCSSCSSADKCSGEK